MAKDFTPYQKKIVDRYYQHEDTIRSDRLSEMVAELWLCEDEKKATQLWGKAQVALMKAGCNAVQVANVVGKRDVEALAKLVQQVDAGKTPGLGSSPAAAQAAPQQAEFRGTPPLEGEAVARGARSLADGRTIAEMQAQKQAEGGYDSLEPGNLKRAMNEFKRKLKSMKRDDESRLSGRYTTKGITSAIVAITPPKEFPAAVWEELVRQGRLKKAGGGTYQMV